MSETPFDVEWITEPSDMAETLYELERHATIAVQVERSYGVSTMYIAVESGPYPDTHNYSQTSLAEPYDIILDGKMRRSPSADFADTVGISHDQDTETVYLKTGVGRFEEIAAITTDTAAVDYDADVSVAAKCGDCGQTERLPVREDEKATARAGMIKTNNGLLTPCCRSSEWTTTLVGN